MFRRITAAAALAVALSAPTAVGFVAEGATAATAAPSYASCTHTSTGSCIRGGGFCPQASYNHSGYSATGKRYVCKGDRVHPHWMLP